MYNIQYIYKHRYIERQAGRERDSEARKGKERGGEEREKGEGKRRKTGI